MSIEEHRESVRQATDDRATAQRILDTAPLLDMGGAIAVALAAARAEEAARWRAKIEALTDKYADLYPDWIVVDDLRALLDES